MKGIISTLNKFPIYALEFMTGETSTLCFCLDNGKISGFSNEGNSNFNKEIPTQTANPSGDK